MEVMTYFWPKLALLPFANGKKQGRIAFNSGELLIHRLGSNDSGIGNTAGSLCIQ